MRGLAVVPVLFALSSPTGFLAEGPPLFTDGFENGSVTGWAGIQRVAADRIRVEDAPGGRAGRAARFEVRRTDHLNGEAPSRAELFLGAEQALEGHTRRYSWSSWLAPDFPRPPRWQNILQWKNEGPGSPPLQMQVNGKELRLQAGEQHGYRVWWSTPLIRGEWLDFEVRIHWSVSVDAGWVEVDYRGRQALPRTPIQGLYPGLRNYLKVGLYRDGSIGETGVVFHDDVEVAAL